MGVGRSQFFLKKEKMITGRLVFENKYVLLNLQHEKMKNACGYTKNVIFCEKPWSRRYRSIRTALLALPFVISDFHLFRELFSGCMIYNVHPGR